MMFFFSRLLVSPPLLLGRFNHSFPPFSPHPFFRPFFVFSPSPKQLKASTKPLTHLHPNLHLPQFSDSDPALLLATLPNILIINLSPTEQQTFCDEVACVVVVGRRTRICKTIRRVCLTTTSSCWGAEPLQQRQAASCSLLGGREQILLCLFLSLQGGATGYLRPQIFDNGILFCLCFCFLFANTLFSKEVKECVSCRDVNLGPA